MYNWLKNLSLLSFFLILNVLGFQLVIYKQYAFESAWLLIKENTNVATVYDLKKLGSICNSLKRPDCATRVFKKVVKKHPNDQEGLANLAIALSVKNKFKEAEPYFKAYFSSGGDAKDVLHVYQENLSQQKLLREINSDESKY